MTVFFMAGELAAMRETAETTMTDSCALQTMAEVSDGQGGTTTTWATDTTVACRVAPPTSADEREVAGQVQPNSVWLVFVPAETDIGSTGRIVCDGHTYQVAKALHRTHELERKIITEMSS